MNFYEAMDELNNLDQNNVKLQHVVDSLIDEVYAESLDEGKLSDIAKSTKAIVKRIMDAAVKGGVAGGIIAGATGGAVGAAVGSVTGAATDIIKEVIAIIRERTEAKLAGKATDNLDAELMKITDADSADALLDIADINTPRPNIHTDLSLVAEAATDFRGNVPPALKATDDTTVAQNATNIAVAGMTKMMQEDNRPINPNATVPPYYKIYTTLIGGESHDFFVPAAQEQLGSSAQTEEEACQELFEFFTTYYDFTGLISSVDSDYSANEFTYSTNQNPNKMEYTEGHPVEDLEWIAVMFATFVAGNPGEYQFTIDSAIFEDECTGTITVVARSVSLDINE